jgi:hypothetical protein
MNKKLVRVAGGLVLAVVALCGIAADYPPPKEAD